ncbi:MAG: hypothetical protein HYV15_03335, partial [Elusimicrobia bacterium]|nr:hypothetical protein [Elusimicrobiota bacterium]
AGIEVKLCDPLYSAEEVRRIAGVDTFAYPDGLAEFDAVAAIVDHDQFKRQGKKALTRLGGCRIVLDNLGMWKEHATFFAKKGIEYHVCGDANWLGPVGVGSAS